MTADNTLNKIISFISELAKELTGKDVIKEIRTYKDPDYGTVIEITFDLDAKETLDLGLKLIKSISFKECEAIIDVKWTGENNVTKKEIEDYLIEVMKEECYRPKAKEPFDAVRELREERNKR
jgi:hypothetical protein